MIGGLDLESFDEEAEDAITGAVNGALSPAGLQPLALALLRAIERAYDLGVEQGERMDEVSLRMALNAMQSDAAGHEPTVWEQDICDAKDLTLGGPEGMTP